MRALGCSSQVARASRIAVGATSPAEVPQTCEINGYCVNQCPVGAAVRLRQRSVDAHTHVVSSFC